MNGSNDWPDASDEALDMTAGSDSWPQLPGKCRPWGAAVMAPILGFLPLLRGHLEGSFGPVQPLTATGIQEGT